MSAVQNKRTIEQLNGVAMSSTTMRPLSPLAGSVVYADVTCPACYLASLRTDLLADAGLDRPDWRFVEHRPSVRLNAVVPDHTTQHARERELASVLATVRDGEPLDADLLPQRVPALLPSTSAAVTAYAEAANAGVGDVVRRLLFAAYWRDGLDLGNLNVLRALLLQPVQQAVARRHDARPQRQPAWRWSGSAEVVPWTGNLISIQGGAITAAGERLVRRWRDERRALEAPACFTLLTAAGGVLSGAAALEKLVLPDELLAVQTAEEEPPLAAAG
jgi:hypothetical protein